MQYAVSGAEIDPWESASCRGESSKRRKIDAEDGKRKPLVPKESNADEQCGAEVPRGNNNVHHGMVALPGKLRGRSRTRLESNRKRRLLSMEMQKRSSKCVSQPDSTPGHKFSFVHLLQSPDLPQSEVSLEQRHILLACGLTDWYQNEIPIGVHEDMVDLMDMST
jgi:hypothetical protein